jgi:hypothetical protein
MYIITNSNNKFLGLKLNNEFEIEENDVIIDNLSNDDLFIGVDDITSKNYLNLLNFTNLSFKELYNDLNPNKKFMEQKKNKSRRIKSIYNLVKQIIDSNKFNLKSNILDKISNNTIDMNDTFDSEDFLLNSNSQKSESYSVNNDLQESEGYSVNNDSQESDDEIDDKIDKLVVLSKTGLLLYSVVVLFTGISFGFYLQKFKR